jgi:hypothetical protein
MTNTYKNNVQSVSEMLQCVAVGCVSNNSEEFSTTMFVNCFKALAIQPTRTRSETPKTGSTLIMNHHDDFKSIISK